MGLTFEKSFDSKIMSVNRKGCGMSGKGLGGSGGGAPAAAPLLPASPVVVRSESTVDLVYDITQHPTPSNIMKANLGLCFDYYVGGIQLLSNQALSSGVNVSVVQGIPASNKSVACQRARAGTNLWAATAAAWSGSHAAYTIKLKILHPILLTLSNSPQYFAGWDYPVQIDRQGTDNGINYTGTYTLVQLSQDGTGGGQTIYKIVLTKGNTGWTYTAAKSYDNTVFFRRTQDATDSAWFATGITW
jgi:hypothetical protein